MEETNSKKNGRTATKRSTEIFGEISLQVEASSWGIQYARHYRTKTVLKEFMAAVHIANAKGVRAW